ncbi:hypothetical protein ALC62_13905 [Cyphomyrmex costatus]|uniref:Uncharacterized protein n=1 Tax=Cyphomyrmex costatus TaxID=456900 RepID=A0A195C3Q0_9HYME|nr:hypothetical protein ALC62_13905 [Cyphomyrmex costatus]
MRQRHRRRDARDRFREAFRGVGIKVGAGVGVRDGDGDGDESALSEASGRRVLVTENRSSQPLATLSCTHTVGFGERDRLSRHAVAAVAVRSTPIVQGHHRTTLTLTLIMRNYVSSYMHMHVASFFPTFSYDRHERRGSPRKTSLLDQPSDERGWAGKNY